jgi:hypothetical protein
MNQDFVTRLQLQLRDAALREERRTPFARRVVRAGRWLPGPAPVAAALAVVVLALAVAFGALALRGEPEPVAPKVVGTYPVGAGLSSLAPGFGAVWGADSIRGQVLKIDLETRRVVARIPVGGDVRVATGSTAVWALAGDLLYAGDQGPVTLVRIDPHTNRIVARIPMRTPSGGAFAPRGLQIDKDAVWVEGAGGMLRIDPDRNVADLFVPLTKPTRGVVATRDRLWVLSPGGRLRELDARTRRDVGEVSVSGAADTHLSRGRRGTLTLIGRNEISVIDPASGRARWRTTLEGDIRYWIPGADGTLWVHVTRDSAGPDRLVRLDGDTGERTGYVDLPEPDVAGMVRVGREVWVGSPGGKVVVVR